MKSMRPAGLAALALAGAILTTQADAQQMIDGTDPDAIVNIVRGYGSGTLEKAGDNTPMVRGRIEGTGFVVYFYGCDDTEANCRSVGFSASWDANETTVDAVNAWNRGKRFGRAYIDDEGDPVLEMDVNLFGSVTTGNFDDTVDWWRIILADFKTNVVDAARAGGGTEENTGGSGSNTESDDGSTRAAR